MMELKHAGTVAMTIAIAVAAIQKLAACLRILVWGLAMEAATPSGVEKRQLRHLQLPLCRLQLRHPLGQLQAQSFRGMAKMSFFMVLGQLVQSTCFVAWACNVSCITIGLIHLMFSVSTRPKSIQLLITCC